MTTLLPRLFLVAFVLAVPASGIAHAETAQEKASRRYFDRGEKLFALGKFEDALEQYQKAYDAEPFPSLLFNIGQCHRNLNDYESAVFSYKKYLKLEPEAPNREQVEGLIEDLERKLEEGDTDKFRLRKKDREPAASAPVYKKWWFWTGIAVVGVAGGIGIYAATSGGGLPDSELGNIVFGP
ncbi:MAG: tetratricopeptide repeat protein [Kofleriaceae bacterium]